VWLAFGQRVATDDAGGSSVHPERRHEWIRQPSWLVGHDTPGDAATLEFDQHFLEPLEWARSAGDIATIKVEKPLAQGIETATGAAGEADLYQACRAMRNMRANCLEGKWGHAFQLAERVQGCSHVRCRVEQGSVQVEQHRDRQMAQCHGPVGRVKWAR
jgi:hypothetical protein